MIRVEDDSPGDISVKADDRCRKIVQCDVQALQVYVLNLSYRINKKDSKQAPSDERTPNATHRISNYDTHFTEVLITVGSFCVFFSEDEIDMVWSYNGIFKNKNIQGIALYIRR